MGDVAGDIPEAVELELKPKVRYRLPEAIECVGLYLDFEAGRSAMVEFRLAGNTIVEIPLSRNAAKNAEQLLAPILAPDA